MPEYIHCCVCERLTPHRKVDDHDIFDYGLECLVCHTVWEAEPEEEKKSPPVFDEERRQRILEYLNQLGINSEEFLTQLEIKLLERQMKLGEKKES